MNDKMKCITRKGRKGRRVNDILLQSLLFGQYKKISNFLSFQTRMILNL